MSRRARQSSRAGDDFIVPDEEMPDVAQGRRRVASQSQSQGDGGFSALTEQQQDEITQRIVRVMLCRNARKRPIRRADLTKHIFKDMTNAGNKNRVFNGAFQRAQTTFRTVFGMEIKQIKRKVKSTMMNAQTQTQRNNINVNGSQSISKPTITKAFILVTTLKDENRQIEKNKIVEIALLTLIAAIILLTPGCKIDERSLYQWLNKLGVSIKDGQKSSHKQFNSGNVKELIEKDWSEQWYLIREKEDNVYYFSLGPRLFAELSDDHLINFIDAVYCIPQDSTTMLDETARLELKQRLQLARKTIQGDEDEDEQEEQEK